MAGLNPTLAAIKRNLPSVARSMGFQARVTSGYRSRAAQTKLYNRYLAGLQPYPVAVPGTSDHEKGLALDVVSTDTEKLVSLLTEVGLRWAGPSDPVHFTMIGAQIANQSDFRSPISVTGRGALQTVEQVASIFYEPAPLKILDFFSDPLGTIENNVGLAIDALFSGFF